MAALVREEIADPALEGMRVSSLALSVDYRHARVHYVLAEGAEEAPVAAALARAAPFLRARLGGGELELKRTPELRFVCDGRIDASGGATGGPGRGKGEEGADA